MKQRRGDVVRLDRTTGKVDDRDPGPGGPTPAQVIPQTHGAGRVVAHRRDPAIGGARPQRHDRRRPGGEPVNPDVGENRLAGFGIGSHSSPVPLAVDLLVGHRPLEHQDERIQTSLRGVVERADEFLPVFKGQDRVVEDHRRHSGQAATEEILDAGVGGRGHRDRITVAPQAGGEPHHVHRSAIGTATAVFMQRRAGHWPTIPSSVDRSGGGASRAVRSISSSRWSSTEPWRCQSPAAPVTIPASESRRRACEIDGRSAATR